MKRKKVSTHTPKLPMRSFVLVMSIFVALIHVFMLRTLTVGTEVVFPIFMLMLILLFDAMFLWWGIIFMTQSRVTLFEEGIELERGGSKIFSTWDNVSHLGVKGYGRSQKRGLFLHEKVTPETKGLAEKIAFGRSSNFLPIGRYVHLPRVWGLFKRDINTDKLLDSEFGQELYDLAPHLFEEYDEWKPKNRLRDDYDNSDYDIVETDRYQQEDNRK
ncbi:MAG: hypothetical protein Phog2KO_32150 [Phototrophicaceae bacterium]